MNILKLENKYIVGYVESYTANNILYENCLFENFEIENTTGLEEMIFLNCLFVNINVVTVLENTNVKFEGCGGSKVAVRYYNKNGELFLR